MAVKRPAPLIEGRRIDGPGRGRAGEVTYSIVETPRPPAEPVGDKRAGARQRTRLRTGKIIDPQGRLLTECLIYDRSPTGGRLRMPLGVALTRSIQLYDEQRDLLQQADVVWRQDREVGIRFRPAATDERSRALQAEMRRRFAAGRG